MDLLDGPFLEPKSGRADALVLILHGYGADGDNLIDLASLWQKDIPQAKFIAPHAPFAFERGSPGYQWFSLENRDQSHMQKGLIRAVPQLNAFIHHHLQELNLSFDRLILTGFSQGAMMSLHVGFDQGLTCAGIVAFSGMRVSSRVDDIHVRPPVLIVHGDQDEVIPVNQARMTEKVLKDANINVQTRIIPYLGHSIDEEGARLAGQFIRNCLHHPKHLI